LVTASFKKGTPNYYAPEIVKTERQLKKMGHPKKIIKARPLDIWAAGATLY
jgi:serine/threonine protein kinase